MISKSHFRLKKNGEPYKDCFCRNPELIENYEKAIVDKTQIWDAHHRREEFYSRNELIERGEYYDRPPEELIFLMKAEHNKIDSACKRRGGKRSEETRRKISKIHKGKPAHNRKKVLCVETGEIFESMMDASRKTGICGGNISAVCLRGRKTAGGYHWRYV